MKGEPPGEVNVIGACRETPGLMAPRVRRALQANFSGARVWCGAVTLVGSEASYPP